MKNALKCLFGLLDFLKIWVNGTSFSEKSQYWKKCLYEFHTLPSNPCQSVRECPKILEICQITNFDMGFQKKTCFKPIRRPRFFFIGEFLANSSLIIRSISDNTREKKTDVLTRLNVNFNALKTPGNVRLTPFFSV